MHDIKQHAHYIDEVNAGLPDGAQIEQEAAKDALGVAEGEALWIAPADGALITQTLGGKRIVYADHDKDALQEGAIRLRLATGQAVIGVLEAKGNHTPDTVEAVLDAEPDIVLTDAKAVVEVLNRTKPGLTVVDTADIGKPTSYATIAAIAKLLAA